MQTSSLDMSQFSLLSGTTTQRDSSNNKQTSNGFQDCTCTTETCNCLIHPPGKDEWIASMRGSLAQTFHVPVMAQALRESTADCGKRSSGLQAYYDQKSCSWKTPQQSLLEDSELFSETWPSWGMTQGTEFYPLPVLVLRTYELDGGALQSWQTPVADDSVNRKNGKMNSRGEPKLSAEVKLWPTPTPTAANAIQGANIPDGKRGATLVSAVKRPDMWATPTVCGNYNRKGMSKSSGDGLATQVTRWPTPLASTTDMGTMMMQRFSGSARKKGVKEAQYNPLHGGQLNPEWVEWLMGWPIGATELNA